MLYDVTFEALYMDKEGNVSSSIKNSAYGVGKTPDEAIEFVKKQKKLINLNHKCYDNFEATLAVSEGINDNTYHIYNVEYREYAEMFHEFCNEHITVIARSNDEARKYALAYGSFAAEVRVVKCLDKISGMDYEITLK